MFLTSASQDILATTLEDFLHIAKFLEISFSATDATVVRAL
jgi:hypothetical protein